MNEPHRGIRWSTPKSASALRIDMDKAIIYVLVGFIIVALFLIIIGFRSALFGIFGSILLIVISWYLAGCIGVVAYIFAGLGMVALIWFVFRKN